MTIFRFGTCYIYLLFFFVHYCMDIRMQLNRASSSSSLSSNDSGTPIDVEGPIDESNGLGYYNNNFQVSKEYTIIYL